MDDIKGDIKSKKLLQEPKNLDVTEAISLLAKVKILANEKHTFTRECCDFLKATVAKIFKYSPLNCKSTHAILSIVPGAVLS